MMDKNGNASANDWNVEDAAMNAMLEIELAGAGGIRPTDAARPSRAATSRRAHALKPTRRWREGVVLAVGGAVLGAVALMVGLDVFGGGAKGEPNDAANANASAVVEDGEIEDSPIQDAPPTDGAVLEDASKLDMLSFDARRLHAVLLELRVQGHGITDESLAAIAKASPNLESLTLFNTDVTDEGFAKHIGTFQKLKRLSLSNSRRITDVGIQALVAASPDEFQEPDAQLKMQPRLPLLEELDLSGFVGQTSAGPEGLPEGYVDPYSKLTDASCSAIALHSSLRRIDLFGTKITHKGLQTLLDAQVGDLRLEGAKPIDWLDVGHTRIQLDRLRFTNLRVPRDVRGLGLVSIPVGSLTSLQWDLFVYTTLAKHFPHLRTLSFGGNGFVPLEVNPNQLPELQKLKELRELHLSWVACAKGMNWAPLAELVQLTSLTLDAVRGDGQATILPAVAELTNLNRLELLNIPRLAPMTRKPMDASEFASDNPVRSLSQLTTLEHLSFRSSSTILESALHLLHSDLPKCRITAADGHEIQPHILKIAIDAGRDNRESGAAVAVLGKDGRVVSIATERTIQFNDVFTALFPRGFKLTSGVRPPVALTQPCYDSDRLDDNTARAQHLRVVSLLPSSPATATDVAMLRIGSESEPLDGRVVQTLVKVPAYDMKRWPTKEIWGSRTPDIAVRVKDAKHEALRAAIAITDGPVEEWILSAPGTNPPDGATKTPAVKAVLQALPDPVRGDENFFHPPAVEVPTGKYWLVVMARGHKPYQAAFEYEAGKPMEILIDIEERKIYAPHITK